MRFTSLLVGVGDRRQPTPRPSPSQPTPNPSQEGRGEMGIIEEVVGKIVDRDFSAIIVPKY
ncbi:MAG: hypothetical protein F6K24_48160 [Okeania sp. SIO2D1]|nr:hypothetical protein [Okeania sp. SIO2D1]